MNNNHYKYKNLSDRIKGVTSRILLEVGCALNSGFLTGKAFEIGEPLVFKYVGKNDGTVMFGLKDIRVYPWRRDR